MSVGLCLIFFVASLSLAVAQPVRVSTAADGSQANGNSGPEAFTPDSRYVVFASYATNLVPGDTNDSADVFVKDRNTGAISRVSVMSDGTERGGHSGLTGVDISDDGNIVVFSSKASLVAEKGNLCQFLSNPPAPCEDVYVHDRTTGQTTRISVTTQHQGNGDSTDPKISGNGRWVVFSSTASNLELADTNQQSDVFLFDRLTATLSRVNVSTSGAQADGPTQRAVISDDGAIIAFVSWSSTLVSDADPVDCYGVPGPDLPCGRPYVRVRATGDTQRLPTPAPAVEFSVGGGDATQIALSGDGRIVAFDFTRLVGLRSYTQVLVHDRATQATTVPLERPGNADVSISRDGRYVSTSTPISGSRPSRSSRSTIGCST